MAEHDNEEIIDLTDVIEEPDSESSSSQDGKMQETVDEISSAATDDFPLEQAIGPKDLEDEFEQLLNDSDDSSNDDAGASNISLDKDMDIESLFEEMEDDILPDKDAGDAKEAAPASPDDVELLIEAEEEEQTSSDDADALFDKLLDTKESDAVKDETDQKDFDELLAKETAKTSETEQDEDLEELLASEEPAVPEVPTPQEPAAQEPAAQEEPAPQPDDPKPESAPEPETPSIEEPEAEPAVEPETETEKASLSEDKPVEDKPAEPEQPVAEAAPEEQAPESEAPAEDLSASVAPEEPAIQEPAVQEPATQEEPAAPVSPDLPANAQPQAMAEETPPAPAPSVDTTLLEELKDRVAVLEAQVQHPDEDRAFAMLTAFFQTSDQGKALIQEITKNVTHELQETAGQLVLEKIDAMGLPLKMDLETLQENIQTSLAKEIPGAAAKIIREEIEALTQK